MVSKKVILGLLSFISLIQFTHSSGSYIPSCTSLASAIQTYPKTSIALSSLVLAAGGLYLWNNPMKVSPKLEDFHLLTYMPTDAVDNADNKLSIDDIDQAIKTGNRTNLNGRYTAMADKSVKLVSDIPSGVTGTLYIYVSGLAGRSSSAPYQHPSNGAATVYKLFERGIIKNAPCVSFAGPTQYRRTVNFGQELDQECLNMVYEEVVKRNPQAKIVFLGVCIGATTILNYLAGPLGGIEKFSHLHAVVLESPYISFNEVVRHMGNSYLPFGLKWLLPAVFKQWFINAKTDISSTQILKSYKNIPTNVKMFISCLKNDAVCSRQNIEKIKKSLDGNLQEPVQVFDCPAVYQYEGTTKTAKHGRLFGISENQTAITDFLKNHELDHVT